jgi:hypothetical protein
MPCRLFFHAFPNFGRHRLARAITPRPFTIFQSRPSSQASAPIAPVAFRVMFFSLAIASISLQYLP